MENSRAGLPREFIELGENEECGAHIYN